MIIIHKKIYILKGVSSKFFWKELDKITAGQHINPELSYTHRHTARYNNVFAGKKIGDQFYIYLFKPKTNFFRTEILAKGLVKEALDGIRVSCRFEIPAGTLIKLLFPIIFVLIPFFLISVIAGLILLLLAVLIFTTITFSNRDKLQKEIKKEFRRIKSSTTR